MFRLATNPATVARKQKLGLCPVLFCNKRKCPANKFCCRHHAQNKKAVDIISYIYSKKKQNAKKYGHEFTIELDNFRDWAKFYGFDTQTAKEYKHRLSIDRKDARDGYHIWNLQPLTVSQNSAKGRKDYVGYFQEDTNGVTHFIKTEIEVPF